MVDGQRWIKLPDKSDPPKPGMFRRIEDVAISESEWDFNIATGHYPTHIGPTPPGTPDALDVVLHLRRYRYRLTTEAALQADVETALFDGGFPFMRELAIDPTSRIDFVVQGGIAIEVKARCNRRKIHRQLSRYAKHPATSTIILLTGTSCGLPPDLSGKPTFVVNCGILNL